MNNTDSRSIVRIQSAAERDEEAARLWWFRQAVKDVLAAFRSADPDQGEPNA